MKKLGWKYWVALVLVVVGLGFLFWGVHIYMSYPGLRELMKVARHGALLQYGVGIGCMVVSWTILTFFMKKNGRKTKI